ncbi:MAG: glycosyltransferase [Mojavia pulchra JT2-VF2]|jgi:glycosyltransferase involved in cell wall biosynthesis|uniref:Glycosyltransferase n=1 Tax=Mojavia pulchra JT2-VF2 TaxID=287848 RepID=A0A951UFA0_9NOST|nr:glycosyltransferase [Mojavia pulchra JT2-VF2]
MTDIAFFLMDLGGGGAEKVMLTLADGFAEQGLKVDFVLVKVEGDYLSLISPKVRLVKLEGKRLITSLTLLVNYLKQEQPKILISALEDTNTIALLAKKLASVSTRVIVTVHNHISRSCQMSTQLKRRLTPLFVRWLYPWADAIVAVSEGVAEDAAQVSGLALEQIKVIHNPIYTSDLIEKYHQPVNHPWFLDKHHPVILGVGRLEKQKDFPTLIRAFALLRQQYPARLMILGQGKELPYLETLVKELNMEEDVAFPGFVANPYAYMAQAKLFVLSSSFEGFGNVLVEAMLAGTPVVSTDCESGPAEILENGKYGKLVAVGDVNGLAEAMINTLNNPPDSELLEQRGREFSLEANLAQYQQVFNFN